MNCKLGQMSQIPRKVYAASSNATSSYRLCKFVVNSTHCKNLFGKANRAFFVAAEEINGSSLQRNDLLPHLLSRPCERRLKLHSV